MLRSTDILFGIVLPAAIALVAFACAWRPWRNTATVAWVSRTLGGIGVLVAFAAAYVLLEGVLPRPPRFPPIDSTHWLLFFTPILALTSVADAKVRAPLIARLVAGLLVIACFTSLLVWKPIVGWTELAIAIMAVSLAGIGAEGASTRQGGWALPVVLTILTASIATVVGTSGSQKLALIGVALSASIGASIPVALWRGQIFSLASGGGAFVTTLVGSGLVLCGRFFASVTDLDAILLLLSPVVAWGVTLLPIKRPWPRDIVVVALALVPCAAACIDSIIQFRKDAEMFL